MSGHQAFRRARTRTLRAVTGTALVALLSVLVPGSVSHAVDTPSDSSAPVDWRADEVGEGWIRTQLERMSLEEKVGQLFVTYAYGETADTTAPADVAANRARYGVDNAAQLIDKYHLGGIIYFAWSNNVNNPRQIAELSNGVQRAAARQRVPVPMLVTTDQEQGIVARVGPPATQFPGNMALGAARNPDHAYTAARITGQELRALGINQNYGPVADVNVNPQNPVIGVRSFGEDPQLVADLTAAQVRGYQQRDGVASTAKHFPGHGDTDVDSHYGFPVINHTREEWKTIDAPPFQAAAEAGIASIMTAHIQVPALDPSGDPATLSRPIITDLLRGELGYDGLVVTDSLGMAGVRQKYGDDKVPVLALQAGVDQLLMPPNLELAYQAVLAAVRNGDLTEQRIDESVRRILRTKFQLGLVGHPYVDTDRVDSVVGTSEHQAESREVSRATTTLVKNDDGVLPLDTGRFGSAFVTGWGSATTSTVAAAFRDRGVRTTADSTGSDPGDAAVDAAVAVAEQHDLTVVTTMRASWDRYDGQRQLVEELVATGKPVVVVAVRDPYDVNRLATAKTYLATYSYTGVALEALVEVLFGEAVPTGRLPVTVPKHDAPGETLYPYGHGLSY